jgi:radical SAM superfamily enzyme YgiQ (UPF0313 family)
MVMVKGKAMNQTILENAVHSGSFPALGGNLKVLMVWPKIPASFWSFQGIMGILKTRAVMPPLGLITLAAMCPKDWEIRLVDQAMEDLSDEDILWANLVVVSAMHVQRDGVSEVLTRARKLERCTIVGGPYASSQPDVLLNQADHVVVGEPDEVFSEIARDLEGGVARRLYEIHDKPDVTKTPIPRFDLLKLDMYASMPIQFSRGCPFQCEFCDIITIYGRKPRTKTPEQVIGELEELYRLGWRKEVFIVDDNFIGNRKRALDLVKELAPWQKAHRYPFAFYTEASIDLAQCTELVEEMVHANFFYVFIGIESPSTQSFIESKKYQNLRDDLLHAVRYIHSKGLWVTGGFIVGFDSDPEDIFDQQIDFITKAAIPWAMIGFLQAPPTTPLFKRMLDEGRLIKDSQATSNFSLPDFHTKMPLLTLLKGYRRTLARLYDPEAFYDRGFRSIWHWKAQPSQKPPNFPVLSKASILFKSIWYQGIRSSYRKAYWKFFWQILHYWGKQPHKLWLGFTVLISGHHFLPYAAIVIAELDKEIRKRAPDNDAGDLLTLAAIGINDQIMS